MVRRCCIVWIGLTAILLGACQGNNQYTESKVNLSLTTDSTSILLKGVEAPLLESLRSDTLSAEEWQSLLLVCRQSPDETMIGLEPPYPGIYQVRGQEIWYTPDTAFVKGNRYRAEFRVPGFYSKQNMPLQQKLPGTAEIQEQVFRF